MAVRGRAAAGQMAAAAQRQPQPPHPQQYCSSSSAMDGGCRAKWAPALSRDDSCRSTQDGFAACCDADRDSSLQDVGGPSRSADALGRDCDATCTSRSTDLPAPRPGRDGRSADFAQHERPRPDDAANARDSGALQQRSASQRHRAAAGAPEQRAEELLHMIRNERAREAELCPRGCFLEQQGDGFGEHITPQMRMIVCSWLAEVACEFSMQQETLFLAVALLDRFLDVSTCVPRGVLQLVAVACMLLASKQDEVVHPSVQELTDIAANCFQTQDLLRMERILLDSLAWRTTMPTAYTFLHLFTQSTAAVRAAGHQQQQQQQQQPAPQQQQQQRGAAGQQAPLSGMVVARAAYLTELALLDYAMLGFRPSQVAAAALLLAQSWSEQGAAVEEMCCISGYGAAELEGCMCRLLHLHQCAAAAGSRDALAPFVFIRDKYAQDCWLRASLQPAAPAAPCQGAPAAAEPGPEPMDE